MKNIVKILFVFSFLSSFNLSAADIVPKTEPVSAQEVRKESLVSKVKEQIRKRPVIAIAAAAAAIITGGLFGAKYAYERYQQSKFDEETGLIFWSDFSKIPTSKKEAILNKDLAKAKKYISEATSLYKWIKGASLVPAYASDLVKYNPTFRSQLSQYAKDRIYYASSREQDKLALQYVNDINKSIEHLMEASKQDKAIIKNDENKFRDLRGAIITLEKLLNID